jgi:hypothetical protein
MTTKDVRSIIDLDAIMQSRDEEVTPEEQIAALQARVAALEAWTLQMKTWIIEQIVGGDVDDYPEYPTVGP